MSSAGDSYEDERDANVDDVSAEPSLLAGALDVRPRQRHRANGIQGVYEHDGKDRWSAPSRIGWIDDDRHERTEREGKPSARDEPVDALLPIIGARSTA